MYKTSSHYRSVFIPQTGESRPAEEPVAVAEKTGVEEPVTTDAKTEAVEQEEEEVEPEPVFDYSYDSMMSGPEIVSVSTDNMLELMYPHQYYSSTHYILSLVV